MINTPFLEHKMEALETMARAIVHEFNNILTTITYSVELALDDIPKNSMAYEDLDRVLKTSVEAGDLISRILSFSTPVKAEFQHTDIVGVVQNTINELSKTLPDTISISTQIRSKPITANACPDQLSMILAHIIDNSVYSLEKEGGNIDVSLDKSSSLPTEAGDTTMIVLSISDDGPGIATDSIDKVFDPFFTTKPKDTGKGLGLSIVYGVVKSHNGFVDVSSIPNECTAFTIYLPMIGG